MRPNVAGSLMLQLEFRGPDPDLEYFLSQQSEENKAYGRAYVKCAKAVAEEHEAQMQAERGGVSRRPRKHP